MTEFRTSCNCPSRSLLPDEFSCCNFRSWNEHESRISERNIWWNFQRDIWLLKPIYHHVINYWMDFKPARQGTIPQPFVALRPQASENVPQSYWNWSCDGDNIVILPFMKKSRPNWVLKECVLQNHCRLKFPAGYLLNIDMCCTYLFLVHHHI